MISGGQAMIPLFKSKSSGSVMGDGTFAVGDVNTTSAETNTESDDTLEKSNEEAPSAGTRNLKHSMVTFALILSFLF
jgi:hypothetical protein